VDMAEARVFVEIGYDAHGEVRRGETLGRAGNRSQFGRTGEDMFAEGVDARDGGAAVDDLAAARDVAGVAEGRTANSLGDEMLVGAVEEGDDRVGCIEAVEAELGEGGKTWVGRGRKNRSREGLVGCSWRCWAAQSGSGDTEIIVPGVGNQLVSQALAASIVPRPQRRKGVTQNCLTHLNVSRSRTGSGTGRGLAVLMLPWWWCCCIFFYCQRLKRWLCRVRT